MNKLKVKICGQEYHLVSEDSVEYMQDIANAVDKKLSEIRTRNNALSISMASILAAMNMADELEKVKLAAREKVNAQAAEIASLKKQLEDIEASKNSKKS